MLRNILQGLIALLFSQVAHADARGILGINYPIVNSTPTSAIVVEDQISGVGPALAYGYANLSKGILRAKAFSGNGSSDGASSRMQFFDYITFNSGASGTIFLDWILSASVAPDNLYQGVGSYAAIYMQVNSHAEAHGLTSRFCSSSLGLDTCVSDRSGVIGYAKTGTIGVPIIEGQNYISVRLAASATGGGWADASNTGKVFLRLPDGVT